MQTAKKRFKDSPLNTRIQELADAGFSLIPLGGGDDGKGPSVKFKDRKPFPIDAIYKRLRETGSSMYGIRLANIVVVDCDTDNPETAEYVEKHFGPSPFTVKTPRGRHYYYRGSTSPKSIREGQVQIDIKCRPNQYVVGPKSTRPDGGIYFEDNQALVSINQLPAFPIREENTKKPSRPIIPIGIRNKSLCKKAIEYASCAESEDELYEDLLQLASIECEDPESISDGEIKKIANWVWKLRLENNLYANANPTVRISRNDFDTLCKHPDAENAHLLLTALQFSHAAEPGKRFAVCGNAMSAAQSIPSWSSSKYVRARKSLVEVGLLILVHRGKGKGNPNLYMLATARRNHNSYNLKYLNDRG